MKPPMTWWRVWTIIWHVKANGSRYTRGQLKYLRDEITRMDQYQRQRFRQECAGVLVRCPA
jgi:hypothetical protein